MESGKPNVRVIEIEGPDGNIYEFPQGMPLEKIHAAMAQRFPKKQVDINQKLPYPVTQQAKESGSSLGNIWNSVKTAAGQPLVPLEQWIRRFQPKDSVGPVGEAIAGTGLGLGRAVEQLTTPTNAAIGLGAGLVGSVGLPGFALNALFSGKMLKDAYGNFVRETPKGAPGREGIANKVSSGLDALMAILPFTKANAAPASKRVPVKTPAVKGGIPGIDAKVKTGDLATVQPKTAKAPIPAEEPIETRIPWYEREAQRQPQRDELEAAIFDTPPPSGPLPETPMGPKANALKSVEEAAEMRMNDIADLIESGLGSLSKKGRTIENQREMTYAGEQGVSSGYGKIRIKGAAGMPELTHMKESPAKIAAAIRKDGDNPLYLRVKDAVKSDINTRYADQISAMERGESPMMEREPGMEDAELPQDFWSQLGFADIKTFPRTKQERSSFLSERANELTKKHEQLMDFGKAFNLDVSDQATPIANRVLRANDINMKNIFGLAPSERTGSKKVIPFDHIRNTGEEGFADIEAKPLGDFMDSWTLRHPKGGNMEVRFGDNSAYVDQVRVPPEMRGRGYASDLYTHLGEMMKERGIPGSALEGNVQASNPAQIARLRAKAAAVAGQGNAAGDRYNLDRELFQNVPSLDEMTAARKAASNYNLDAEMLKILYGDQSGFARSNKDQQGFNFVPVDIPGQAKKQAEVDLLDQLLKAPESAVSKRDLLGINKKKKSSESSGIPLFENDKLF